MPKTTEKPFVAICRHDATGEIDTVYVGTYDEVLAKAGKFWKARDLDFDDSRKDPFYVKPESGYNDEVCTSWVGNKVHSVMHAGGDGPCINIVRAK